MRIDVHTHYRTPQFLEQIEELGAFDEITAYKILRTQIRPLVGVIPDQVHVRERLAEMDASGIDMQILSIGALQPYFPTAEKAVAGARLTNDMHRSLVERHPTRFGQFGCLPMPHVDESIAEIGRLLDDLDCVGINMGTSAGGIPLDDPAYDAVWAELDRRSAVVFLHPGTEDQRLIGSNEFHLAPDFGAPAELSVTLTRLIVSGHTTRFPNIRIIAAMTGGLLPQMLERYEKGLRQSNPELAASLGGVAPHLRKIYYDTCIMEEPDVLDAAIRRFGADQLVMGSDYGRPTITCEQAVDYVQAAALLSEDEKTGVLGGNAAALLGLTRTSRAAS